MSLPLRKVVFWIHLVCGVTAGSVILIMSVTGVLLTYQKQMTQWGDREYWVESSVPGERASPSSLIASVERYDPTATVSSLVYHEGADGPAAASLGGGRTVYLDPSTAEVRGENRTGLRGFLSGAVRLHRWLGVSGEGRARARAITGWSNVVFLLLVLSGLYLWFPRRWTVQHLRPILLFNHAARGRARDFNWHHVFGFWMAIPLAVVVASATVISFPWASDLAYRIAGDEPPQRGGARNAPAVRVTGSPSPLAASLLGAPIIEGTRAGAGVSAIEGPVPFDPRALDPLLTPAVNRLDEWRTITFRLPDEGGVPVEVRIEQGWGGEPQKRHTVRYDAASGRELSYETFADQSSGRRFRTFLRFAHTGEYFGILGQTLAGVASLAAVFLVWSGLALAWRRLITPRLGRWVAARP